MSKTVIDLVKQSLIDGGYDGLYNEYGECGCDIDYLRPCDGDFAGCKPGYKGKSRSGEYDFVIYGSKEYAEESLMDTE